MLWLKGSLRAAGILALSVVMATTFAVSPSAAGDINSIGMSVKNLDEAPAGYRNLLQNQYVPPQLDQEVFDNLWRTWETDLKKKAESASAAERREMTLTRYGLTKAPGRIGGNPLK